MGLVGHMRVKMGFGTTENTIATKGVQRRSECGGVFRSFGSGSTSSIWKPVIIFAQGGQVSTQREKRKKKKKIKYKKKKQYRYVRPRCERIRMISCSQLCDLINAETGHQSEVEDYVKFCQ